MIKTIKRIFELSGSYRPRIVSGIVFSLLHSVVLSLEFFAVLYMINSINNLDAQVIRNTFILLMIGIVGKFLCKWTISKDMSSAGYDIFRDKRIEIGEKLKRAPMGYFSEKNIGAIHMAITTGIGELEASSMMVVESILGGIIYSFVCTIVLFLFKWQIGLITLIGLLGGMYILNITQKRADSIAPAQIRAKEEMTGKVLEYVQGIAVIRLFGKNEFGKNRVEECFKSKKDADLNVEKQLMWPVSLYRYIFRLASCLIVASATILCYRNQISFAFCTTFLFSAFLVYSQIDSMASSTALLRVINTALNYFDTVLNIPEMEGEKVCVPGIDSDIEIKDISFSYEERKIIHNLTTSIKKNQKVAIVGPSGGGKTTLCNLIARFWDVQEGEILYAGTNIKEYSSESLLSNITMVFQNVYLFNDTIENNIRFGNPNASADEVIAAALKARCHEFISNLPDGYNTIVGEGGSTLSGGEKQRISIARAMLKEAPIVILDEATSSVDPENEHALVSAIKELTRNRTLITIAHRLSTIKNADKILVLDNGRIVQEGTHQQLINQSGIYKDFINIRKSAATWKINN